MNSRIEPIRRTTNIHKQFWNLKARFVKVLLIINNTEFKTSEIYKPRVQERKQLMIA